MEAPEVDNEEGVELSEDADEEDSDTDGELPEGIKARLGRQEKRHKRQLKQMESELSQLRQAVVQSQVGMQDASVGAYSAPQVDPWTGEMLQDDSVEATVARALAAQKEQERQQQLYLAKQQEAAMLKKIQDEYLENVSDAADKYDDYDDVVASKAEKFTPDMQLAAQFVSNPGDVIYALAKNSKELDRISRLPKYQQMRAMVKFAEDFHAKKQARKVSKAPKPVTPTRGTGKPRGNDPSRMSYQELKLRDRERQKNRRR